MQKFLRKMQIQKLTKGIDSIEESDKISMYGNQYTVLKRLSNKYVIMKDQYNQKITLPEDEVKLLVKNGIAALNGIKKSEAEEEKEDDSCPECERTLDGMDKVDLDSIKRINDQIRQSIDPKHFKELGSLLHEWALSLADLKREEKNKGGAKDLVDSKKKKMIEDLNKLKSAIKSAYQGKEDERKEVSE